MLSRLRSLANALLHRTRFEQAMRDEMGFHLDAYADDLVQRGLSREEAQRRARLEFGAVDAVKDDCREARGLRLFDQVLQDLRYAGRMMVKTKGVTAAAILSLALGIGANTAIFSLIDAVMLRQVAVADPSELFFLAHGRGDSVSTSSNYPLFERYAAAGVLTGTAAYTWRPLKVSTPNGIELVPGQYASANYHRVLGPSFVLGRGFDGGSDRGAPDPAAAVISDAYWQRAFGRDVNVLGTTLKVQGHVVTIVGVTHAAFTGLVPGTRIDITLPMSLLAWDQPGFLDMHDTWTSMPLVVRLTPGVQLEQARATADTIFRQYVSEPDNKWIVERAPEAHSNGELLPAGKGSTSLRRRYETAITALMFMVAIVLIIACANIANLLLGRSAARAREVAIRLCVGGARSRIVRQFLTESLLLAACGGALGVIIAIWGTGAILSQFQVGETPVYLDVAPNVRVFAFTAFVAIVTGLAFGLLPALKATQLDLTPALKVSDGRPAGYRRGSRIGKVLVVSQVALCVLVVTAAVLLVRTLHNLKTQSMGFTADRLLLFYVDTNQTAFPPERLGSLYGDVVTALRATPGVVSASSSTSTPVHTEGNARALQIPGAPVPRDPSSPLAGFHVAWANLVTPSYFETLGITLLRGRAFTEHDTAGARKVAIVNESLAREYFPSVDPIGRTFGFGTKPDHEPIEIVGIARDAHQATLRERPPRMVYTPLAQSDEPPTRFTVAIRTAGHPGAMAAPARDAVQRISPDVVVGYMRTIDEQIDASLVRERVMAKLSTSFGLLALVLALIGLYGVMAYDVARRAREIAIRMAVGAGRITVLGQILRETGVLTAVGIVIGVVAAAGAASTLATFLFELSPRDPATLAAVAAVLFVTAMLAGFFPARRAASIDPAMTMRTE